VRGGVWGGDGGGGEEGGGERGNRRGPLTRLATRAADRRARAKTYRCPKCLPRLESVSSSAAGATPRSARHARKTDAFRMTQKAARREMDYPVASVTPFAAV